jgi:hypothetical protein
MRHRGGVRAAAALAFGALLAVGAAAVAPHDVAATGQPGVYRLTQAHCVTPQGTQPRCRLQTVPVGAVIEIQVPGTPSVWAVQAVSGALEGTGDPVVISSPGRIDGTSDVYVFRFRASGPGPAGVILRETPAHVSDGTFVFPFEVR